MELHAAYWHKIAGATTQLKTRAAGESNATLTWGSDVPRVGNDVYQTPDQAEVDVKRLCKEQSLSENGRKAPEKKQM
jgi:hypothetical protein